MFLVFDGLRPRSARIRSLHFGHIALASEPANPRMRARFIGSGNVVSGRPLGASLFWALIYVFARRPGAQSKKGNVIE